MDMALPLPLDLRPCIGLPWDFLYIHHRQSVIVEPDEHTD